MSDAGRLNPWSKAGEVRLTARSRWRWYWWPRFRIWLPLMTLIAVAGALWVAVEYRSLLPEPQFLADKARRVVASLPAPPFAREERHIHVRFGFCDRGNGTNCVIDGDTLHVGGVRIRLADIDAPELRSAKCASELARARQATQRLNQLLNEGPVQIVPAGYRDEDRYGRKLRVIERNGRSLGGVLVSEGLARPWDGARRSWFG